MWGTTYLQSRGMWSSQENTNPSPEGSSVSGPSTHNWANDWFKWLDTAIAWCISMTRSQMKSSTPS